MTLSKSYALALLGLFALTVACSAKGMIRQEPKRELQKPTLQATLNNILGSTPASHLFNVEAGVRQTFEAFPKNSLGQVPVKGIFPAIIRSYFAKEHGWVVKGLEPPSMVPYITEAADALILKEKTPALVEALREAQKTNHGLSLSDVVATIAAIEHFLLNESVEILEDSYTLNNMSSKTQIDEEALHDVLQAYLLIFRQGSNRTKLNPEKYRRLNAFARRHPEDFEKLVAFEHDIVKSAGMSPPFDFGSSSHFVKDLAEKYGKWQNGECVQMKRHLMSLDSEEMGLVPFDVFHNQPEHSVYVFSETEPYLRKVGALDESEEQQPKVRIPNYLLGSSNCIASAKYYAVCCLNECVGIVDELEKAMQGPTASATQMAEFVSALSDEALSQKLVAELKEIEEAHGGEVTLHSPEFQQWLHRAFPYECPYLTAADKSAEEIEEKVMQEWLDVQEECTRVPMWETAAAAEEAIVTV